MFRMANIGKVCKYTQTDIPKKVAPEKNAKNNLPAEIWTSSEIELKNKSVVCSDLGRYGTLDGMGPAQWEARSVVKMGYGCGLVSWSALVLCGMISPIEGIYGFFIIGFGVPLMFRWFIPYPPLVILFDNETGVLSLLVRTLGLKKDSKMFIHIPPNCGDVRVGGPDEATDLLAEQDLSKMAEFIKHGILEINAPVDLDSPFGPLNRMVIPLRQAQIDQVGEFLNGTPGLKETEVGKELKKLYEIV